MSRPLYYLPSTEYDLWGSEDRFTVDKSRYALAAGDTVVVFLSYGKVGSTAVCQSLANLDLNGERPVPVYHLHSFKAQLPPHRDRSDLHPHLLSGHALRHSFSAHRDRFQWKFINGVREPISMLVSAYFENRFAAHGAPSDDDLLRYSKNFIKWLQDHNDLQYGREVGLDVYGAPFDHAKGYDVISDRDVSVLTYRLDALSGCFEESMRELLGVGNLKLKKANTAADKSTKVGGVTYADAYKTALANFRMPADMLDPILEHRSVAHFYETEEIARIRERWVAA